MGLPLLILQKPVPDCRMELRATSEMKQYEQEGFLPLTDRAYVSIRLSQIA